MIYNDEISKRINRFSIKLQKSGICLNRSMNAIISTSCQNERVAGQWIAAHADDPDVDEDMLRQYFIYLVPQHDIYVLLLDYWKACRLKTGSWNSAHEFPPHITILPPFLACTNSAASVFSIVEKLAKKYYKTPTTLNLEYLTCTNPENSMKNFLGYQAVGDQRKTFELFSMALLKELENVGITLEDKFLASRKGIYHLSLAYGCSPSEEQQFSELAKEMIPEEILQNGCQWELRLLSCDARASASQAVISMRTDFISTDESCLSYLKSDCIGLLGSEDGELEEGWSYGMNVNTGMTGVFRTDCGERVPYFTAWSDHRFCNLSTIDDNDDQPVDINDNTNQEFAGAWSSSWALSPMAPSKGNESDISSYKDHNPDSTKLTSSNSSSMSETGSSRSSKTRVFIMRHAERIDFTFGQDWMYRSFDNQGNYKRLDLNMPSYMPNRNCDHFILDTPITLFGQKMAQEVGHSLKCAATRFSHCYASPALRCIQTANEVLKGCGQADATIRIEPFLFEWLAFYTTWPPKFLTPGELHPYLPADLNYKPFSCIEDLDPEESIHQYIDRSAKIMKKIVDLHKKKGQNILIVGHAGSLEACSRPLLKSGLAKTFNSDSSKDFQQKLHRIPYCAILVLEERHQMGPSYFRHWRVIDSPNVVNFSHSPNFSFDAKHLMLPGSN